MTERKNEAVFKRMTQVGITFLVQMLFLFLLAGSVRWVWAWVLLGINILVLAVNSIILPKELISERGKPKENVKKWDKIITVISIFPVLCIYIISGLDQRSGWTGDVSLWVHFTGVLMMLLGNGIFTWAMMSNKFFSTVVRIQDDRNHSVATAGPYKIVRHPGYTGFILQTLSTPLILGTIWGFIPAGIVCILFIIRTVFEDSTLKKELNGYKAYANRVHHRLIPGIW